MNWTTYWNQPTIFDRIMRFSTRFFCQRADAVLGLEADSRILDIGCGPGYLEEYFVDRVEHITALEVSETYLQQCTGRFRNQPGVNVLPLDVHAYTQLPVPRQPAFTHAIVLSVLQYYRNASEVKALLAEIRPRMRPGGRILLADLIVQPGSILDVLTFLVCALRAGFLLSALVFLWRCRFSEYFKMRADNGLLVLDAERWMQILQELGLSGRWIKRTLTCNPTRANLLIEIEMNTKAKTVMNAKSKLEKKE